MKFYVLITFVAVLLYFTLKPADLTTVAVDSAPAASQQDVLAVQEMRPIPKEHSEAPNVDAAKPAIKTDSSQALGRANIGVMLKQLAECTEIKNSLPPANAEPTLTTILDSVQSELGEPVIHSEDWNSTEIRMPDNTTRLIRLETVYQDDDIVKKLKYYQSTETQLQPLELSAEQKINPSETFIASLESEGEIVSKEKSERVFFQNGEEISYTAKNGKIQTSEIIRAGKSLKCSEYGQSTFRCQCF